MSSSLMDIQQDIKEKGFFLFYSKIYDLISDSYPLHKSIINLFISLLDTFLLNTLFLEHITLILISVSFTFF